MAFPYEIGQKFIVIGNSCSHDRKNGDTVKVVIARDEYSFYYDDGTPDSTLYINMKDVRSKCREDTFDDSLWFTTPVFTSSSSVWTLSGFDTLSLPKTKKPIMKQLSSMMKRLLDVDTQTLVKAGFLDNELALTVKGTAALVDILFAANKAELVTAAQAVLDAEAAAK